MYASPEGESHSLIEQQKFDIDVPGDLDEMLQSERRKRATGFIGKSSEIHWLHSSSYRMNVPGASGWASLPCRTELLSSKELDIDTASYWTATDTVEMSSSVHVDDLPPPETIERLLRCYLDNVHNSFPIFSGKVFKDQCTRYIAAIRNNQKYNIGAGWEATFYLVLAIAAKYSHLTKATWRAHDPSDHVVYQERAREVSSSDTAITSPCDVQQVQSLGLLAFYCMFVGDINRAWVTTGLAVRCAYTSGLHARDDDPSASASTKEALLKTWWSLHWLDSTLSIMTGRPGSVVDSRCNVPLPVPIPEERIFSIAQHISQISLDLRQVSKEVIKIEANSGSYFRAIAQLSIITQSTLAALYSAGIASQGIGDIQAAISHLERRMEQWLHGLPIEFDPRRPFRGSSEPFLRERVLLGFRFYSVKILLTRPCLMHHDQSWMETGQRKFATRSALACVEAAQAIVAYLPDGPHWSVIRDHGPWWNLIHYVMQAVSVLMLALYHGSVSSRDDLTLLQGTKKAIAWMRKVQDPFAARAFKVALHSLDIIAERFRIDISDLRGTRVGESLYEGMTGHASYDTTMTGIEPTSHHDEPGQVGGSYEGARVF